MRVFTLAQATRDARDSATLALEEGDVPGVAMERASVLERAHEYIGKHGRTDNSQSSKTKKSTGGKPLSG